jgi:predicted GNAT family N-acyltransferase
VIQVRIVTWDQAHGDLRGIRHEVFVVEQQVPEADEWDSYDQAATHFLASERSGKPVGTARLLPSGKITRMAVRRPYRNRKVGSQILAAVLNHAAGNGFQSIYLDAQIAAVPFYEKFGFAREGEVFEDAGIDHVRMTKNKPGAFDEH